jgi:D-sedoheptulose 7-phosphate isomerase
MAAINDHARSWEMPEVRSSEEYFRRLARIIPQLPYRSVDAIAGVLVQAFDEGRTIFVFGNGGSAASASHMMCDMNKGAAPEVHGRRLKVMALTDNVPLITAWANDSSYEQIFAEQLRNYLQPGDVAFAVSCSGDSPNVVLGLKTARAMGAVTVGIAGRQGGKMKSLCDVCALVPSDDMRMIEDMHHAILHSLSVAVAAHVQARSPQIVAAAAGRNGR